MYSEVIFVPLTSLHIVNLMDVTIFVLTEQTKPNRLSLALRYQCVSLYMYKLLTLSPPTLYRYMVLSKK